MPDWPWPETREQRRTRIAHLYRDALYEAAPHVCYELDATLDGFGQHWITGNKPPINTDQPMTAAQIAQWEDITIQAVTNRVAARGIKPVGRRAGRKTYRLADFTKPPPCTTGDCWHDAHGHICPYNCDDPGNTTPNNHQIPDKRITAL